MEKEGVDYVSFLEGYIDTGTTAIILLSAVLSAVGVVVDLIPSRFVSEFALVVLLGIVITRHYRDWETYVRAEKSIDLQREKEESDVMILSKSLKADISVEDKDIVKHSYTLTSTTEDNYIDRYIALIFTDQELHWKDLNLTYDGCELVDYGRRWGDGRVEFPIELKLPNSISKPATHNLSYTVEYDTLDVESDWVSTLIREPTNHIRMCVSFPENSSPEDPTAYEIHDGDYLPSDPSPTLTESESGQQLVWERSEVDMDTEYAITWGDIDIEELIS